MERFTSVEILRMKERNTLRVAVRLFLNQLLSARELGSRRKNSEKNLLDLTPFT